MRKALAVTLGLSLSCTPLVAAGPRAMAAPATLLQDYGDDAGEDAGEGQGFSSEQLENLLAPIALYPDPLLAQVLLAATFVDEVDEAARHVRAYGEAGIDDGPWDVSVKAVARYPVLLSYLADHIDWTATLGQAYAAQSTDVMISVQHLRRMALSLGNLETTPEQEVVVEGDDLRIVPAQAGWIYVPRYSPGIVYHRRPSSGLAISFGVGRRSAPGSTTTSTGGGTVSTITAGAVADGSVDPVRTSGLPASTWTTATRRGRQPQDPRAQRELLGPESLQLRPPERDLREPPLPQGPADRATRFRRSGLPRQRHHQPQHEHDGSPARSLSRPAGSEPPPRPSEPPGPAPSASGDRVRTTFTTGSPCLWQGGRGLRSHRDEPPRSGEPGSGKGDSRDKRTEEAQAIVAILSGLALVTRTSNRKGVFLMETKNTRRASLCVAAILVAAGVTCAAAPALAQPTLFPTPEAAMQALAAAGQSKDQTALARLFGASSEDLLTGDRIEDAKDLEELHVGVQESTQLRKDDDSRYTVLIGKDKFPFPLPIVRQGTQWLFDTTAGLDEILNRRSVETSCPRSRRVAPMRSPSGSTSSGSVHHPRRLAEYAQRFISASGERNGLYWETSRTRSRARSASSSRDARRRGTPWAERPAPRGVPRAGAAVPWLPSRILKVKASRARRPYGYVINGNMIAGFALVAYPDKWGARGHDLHRQSAGPRLSEEPRQRRRDHCCRHDGLRSRSDVEDGRAVETQDHGFTFAARTPRLSSSRRSVTSGRRRSLARPARARPADRARMVEAELAPQRRSPRVTSLVRANTFPAPPRTRSRSCPATRQRRHSAAASACAPFSSS